MGTVSWTDALSAIGSIATPLVVLVLGFMVSRRQSRNDELLKARIEYYRLLAPDLNTLMCYMTFIGTWRDNSPQAIVELKRRLDHNFFCASPLFSGPVRNAYEDLARKCFSKFNAWGQDAKIRSGPYRRREAWRGADGWSEAWDDLFTKSDTEPIYRHELQDLRSAYDRLIAALVADLNITRARSEYTTNLVSLNAHAPQARDIDGRTRDE